MPSSDDALTRFERRLAQAVADFAAGLERTIGPLGDGNTGRNLAALRAEEARLRRKARRNAPCYDINRHIAVCRLIAACGG